MQNTHRAFLTLDTLKNMVLKISIDDFGAGFSSFAYVKKLLPYTIKIDKSFIDDINPANSEAIVSAIISIYKIL